MDLTVIVPAYNEETRLGKTLKTITSYLEEKKVQFELLVVNDGSIDRTVEIAQRIIGQRTNCRVISLARNSGKGAAVRRGMQEAQGEFILFSDADLSTPIEEYFKLRRVLDDGADVAIGSRALTDSQVLVHQPWYREKMGKTFNLLVRLILWLPISDTQCGFKCFRREAALLLAGQQQVDGWAFDAELLFIARKQGLKITEVPVQWVNDRGTKVGIISSSTQMLWSTLKIRLRCMTGGYRTHA